MINQSVSKSVFSLLNTDYVKLNKTWNYRNIVSPFYRLYLIDDGLGKLHQADKTVILEKDHLYLIPSFTLCNYHCPEFLSQYYIHFLEESPDGRSLFSGQQSILKIEAKPSDHALFKRILFLNPGRNLIRSYNPKDYQKQLIIQSAQLQNNDLPIAVYLETKGILLQLLAKFLTPENYNSTSTIPNKILDTIYFIQDHLGERLIVTELAERVCQNPDYFSRLFQEHTGARPLAFIQQKRIERAQFLMLTTELSLGEIAAQAGFESLSYFSRVFKNIIGQTPGVFGRNNHTI